MAGRIVPHIEGRIKGNAYIGVVTGYDILEDCPTCGRKEAIRKPLYRKDHAKNSTKNPDNEG